MYGFSVSMSYEREPSLLDLESSLICGDGSILTVGKENPDWNQSTPHGAGHLLSRSQAKRQLNVEKFADTMKDVYTNSVGPKTLAEAQLERTEQENHLR